jgi:hypothetical protein
LPFDAVGLDEVVIVDAERNRLVHQEVIDVTAQPVRVGQFVARAGCDKQLIRPLLVRRVRAPGLVLEVGKSPLQSAAEIGVGPLPRTKCRKRPDPRQVVAICELLDQDSGKRRRRLADCEPRMSSALEQHHSQSQVSRDHREQRTAESGPHDREIEHTVVHASIFSRSDSAHA